ncbi:MAG: tRNA (N(6)-L-threonylcarbamoyladenosine(37)-C(2))-methylthiotransferase MtaB [Alphaproteobacteria bacterium]|nr:tRNA (N(6)-L-threonylcarbamoyladenosine(37)-C(2))-methylthiotransferase MtaB [Alphaproteobacteria bacterium]
MSGAAPEFETLGCRLNAYESEAMRTLGQEAGLSDTIVVNTCAVTAEAVRQAKQKIRRLRRQHPDRKIVVTGCAAQVEPEIFLAMDEVDLVVGNHEKLKAQTWSDLAAGAITERSQVRDIMTVKAALSPKIDGFGTRARAYVQIQNGCDHRCTFCIIPYGRGNSRSVGADVVVKQVTRLVAKGFNEVVLTGVDMTSWGADLDDAPKLGALIDLVLKRVPDLPRLRISSIDSIEVDAQLFELISTEARLMPHLHLSLQAGDDMILKRMKRRHLRGDAIRICAKLRALRPDIVFGADIIAGFPTETEAMFENSLKLVTECDLTWLHVFPYSIRQGTPAARMPQVDKAVIRTRAGQLRALGATQIARYQAAQLGKTHRILTENPRMGRTEGFAPVSFASDQPVGKIVSAEITGHDGGMLTA